MNKIVRDISKRLSLRAPQNDSLDILANVTDLIMPGTGPGSPLRTMDAETALHCISAAYPSVTDFEREFPSLCFALATGVGKTRLMGAFISYLYLARGIRHFFVLAPNLTIYDKLIRDFTPNTPKYVFQGIAEFSGEGPEIITGDNYESGRGVRDEARAQPGLAGIPWQGRVHINIFNISKINSEVRGGSAPRIRRLSEYIGQSYFDYLAGLDDLVLLMDESHRYRASAGVRAINELKPILGLELTATPQVEKGTKTEAFKNVIYSYPLSRALTDGYVKEPAVVTRENFNHDAYSDEQLEQLKLEDGIRVHEDTKMELENYATQTKSAPVKPFMLVVAQDTEHAESIVRRIRDDAFFGGRYRDKVITVHSNQRGEEKEETVKSLLSVEDPQENTEIVIHVNMLKEGWDVTNLYTIVPLRAANSRTLVEQSIGRGLRLPYGRRTGVRAVDRLHIIAHDRFQEIIDEANRTDSIIRTGVVIGRDIAIEQKNLVTVNSAAATMLAGAEPVTGLPPQAQQATLPMPKPEERPAPVFRTAAEQKMAKGALETFRLYEYLPCSAELLRPEIQAEIVRAVRETLPPAQMTLAGMGGIAVVAAADQTGAEPAAETRSVEEIVRIATEQFVERLQIDIPKVIIVPSGGVSAYFEDFELDISDINLLPVSQDILIHQLGDNQRERLRSESGGPKPARSEDYLVGQLIDYDDICYDEQADLLYKLSGQVVARLRDYLKDEDEVDSVLRYYRAQLAEWIHQRMQPHYRAVATTYEARVTKGFMTPGDFTGAVSVSGGVREFREPLDNRQEIRSLLFQGFRRCLYPAMKFDSDTERRFAILLEDDPDVLKWVKPPRGQFYIWFNSEQKYEPDFVVETRQHKYLCEPKRESEMSMEETQEKKRAALAWCEHATRHELQHDGKPWSYLLIPHTAIESSRTLHGLSAMYAGA